MTYSQVPTQFCSHCGDQLLARANFCSQCATPAHRFNERSDAVNASTTRGIGLLLAVGIFIMPYIFSWLTLRKGHSSLARILSFAWLAVFVVGNLMALRQPTSVRNQAPRTSVINTQPLATPMTSPKKATTTSPPVEAWATKESRDIGGMLFIKPYLRQWLKDPDSLQDFEVIDARPNKTLQDSFR